MDRQSRRLLFPDLAHNAAVPPLLLPTPGSAQLDAALYALLVAVCQQFILPWYGQFTSDRQLFFQITLAARTLAHQVQVRVGSARAFAAGIDTALGARAARTRVVSALGERLPRILLQHVRSYRGAQRMASVAERMGEPDVSFSACYLAACPSTRIPCIAADLSVSDAYLAATASALLTELAHAHNGAAGLQLAHLESLLVRDIVVHAVRTAMRRAAPWALVAMSHTVLDRHSRRQSPMRSVAGAVWTSICAALLVAWTLASLVIDALTWQHAAPKDPAADADIETLLVVPSITAHYFELLAEMLDMRARPLGMVCYALADALVTVVGGVIDRAISRLIVDALYNDEHVIRAVNALCASLAATPTEAPSVPPSVPPSADAERAAFERLCQRCWLLVPETLRPVLLGPSPATQLQTTVHALAPFFAPDASVALVRSAVLIYESTLLVLCPELDTPTIPIRP